jgi:hypothetical protein
MYARCAETSTWPTTHTMQMGKEVSSKSNAKDKAAHAFDSNYIGTEKPAHDASMVFIPARSSQADLQEAVAKTAFGKEHYANSFGMFGRGT